MSYITDDDIIKEVLDTIISYNIDCCKECHKRSGEVSAHFMCNEHFLYCAEAIEECLKKRKIQWEKEIEKYNNDLRYKILKPSEEADMI